MKKRPQTYPHGDYHIGNMMIGNNGQLYVIDFNRNDYGDPWEEFNRIVWSAQATPLSSLSWAIPFGQEQIDVMIKQAQDVLEWYDDMVMCVPKWYTNLSLD